MPQLARLMGRSEYAARWLRARWQRAGWAQGRVVLARRPAFVWPTRTGLRLAGAAYKAVEPNPGRLAHIEAVVDEMHVDEMLFLTDLEGSTPYNLCCKKCGGTSVVLSGMNLPMLMKLATANRALGALTLAEELRATGLKSIHIRSANGTK